GGDKALQLRIAEDYLERFGELAKAGNTLILPSNLADMASMIGAATKIFQHAEDR
ncbi:MAG: paraslipin, partial [Gammaproteobacteria bacterium]|nr:paraslipin [Gammaproteobacteria bacterium]